MPARVTAPEASSSDSTSEVLPDWLGPTSTTLRTCSGEDTSRRWLVARPLFLSAMGPTNSSAGRAHKTLEEKSQVPFCEKCWRSFSECQVPPQVQPIESKARTTGPSGSIIPGRTHPRCEVRRRQLRQHQVALRVGVLERVHVDRQAVGVLGVRRRAARRPAVERTGVVPVAGRRRVQLVGAGDPHLLDAGTSRRTAGGTPRPGRRRRTRFTSSSPVCRRPSKPTNVSRTQDRSVAATGQPGFQVERAMTSAGAGVVTREAKPVPGQRRQRVRAA